MWPPTSPDLNPMDVSVWSLMEAKVCSFAHPSVDALKTSLLSELAKIPQKTLRASVGNFEKNIKRLMERTYYCTVHMIIFPYQQIKRWVALFSSRLRNCSLISGYIFLFHAN